ncbi:MAG: GAF domain-containing protein [Anaerolineales bacterium]|nr:GAF domain-containing protein [Anaerolineales bacterium]
MSKQELQQAQHRAERSERAFLALSAAFRIIQQARSVEDVYRVLGQEVVKLGYHTSVYNLNNDLSISLAYLTYTPKLISRAEKLTGLSAKDFHFQIKHGGIFDQVITLQRSILYEEDALTEFIADILPASVRPLTKRLIEILGLKRGILAPLVINNSISGLIAITGEDLSESDIPAVSAFAGAAAIALNNAKLYQDLIRDAERRDVLHRVSREIALKSRDLNELYRAIYHAAQQLMPADNFTIALHDEARGEFIGVYLIDEGKECPPVRASIQDGLSGYIIRTGATLRIGDVLIEDAPTPVHFGSDRESRAYLCVPLRSGEKIIGAMTVQSYQPNVYTQKDEVILEMLAGYAGSAIENARLFEAELRHAENLRAINDLGRALAETFDMDEIYDQVRQYIYVVLPEITGVMINLYDDEKQIITCAYCYTDDAVQDISSLPPIPIAPSGEGTQSKVIRSRQPLIINHFQEQLRKSRIHISVGQRSTINRSSMYVPMLTQGKVIGLIIVQSTIEGRFNKEDVELTWLIANTTAVAIENARLLRGTRRHLQELEALNIVSTALRAAQTVEEALPILLDQTLNALDCEAGEIALYDPASGGLRQVQARGWLCEVDVGIIKPGEGVYGAVFTSGQVYFIKEITRDPLMLPAAAGKIPPGWCGACAPIRSATEALGVLSISTRLPKQIPPEDMNLPFAP